MLHKIIVEAWQSGKAPLDWKRAVVAPILKKGDPSNPENYQGTSLLKLPGKVYALVLRHRLESWVKSILIE
jgi:hypothetical protein